MPAMSRKYCKNTPIGKMGFSQKASCKAQGYIARTSKSLKGKYVKSRKYKSKSRKRSKDGKSINKSLYNNGSRRPRTVSGYGSEEKAKQTLRNIKKFDKQYQMQVVNTMYNRAKYHAHQTKDMRSAMRIFKKWLT